MTQGAGLPYLTVEALDRRLDWVAVADAIADGHRGADTRLSDQFLTRGPDTLLSRAAWIDGMGVGVKSVTVMPGNPDRGLPSVHGVMVVFEDRDGRPVALIDSALVTKWKTAADSVLGARLLARKGAKTHLILGAGAVARSLVAAYRAQFPGIETVIWNRSPDKAAALAREVGAGHVTDLEAAVAGADIISTATMSRTPVLDGAWLRPGQHLDLIGAFTAEMREVDDTALTRAALFVDSRETTLDHIGELKDPLARGVIGRADVKGDLSALVAGTAGRTTDDEITLFKNGGGAHLDLMVARHMLDVWQASGAG
ncbi:ornithine cyclodeaminase family protein [Oceanomicrobium pacificus]|uniref:NAD(P)-binding domain-containing protein n=1 Tax=Oceanomicrobium pacificus TaxID=2692916 RepID=A0A6B0TTA3_9RHOB|nr:NAD(P)-binding domain-containing protein [Oceanomicrobium pacificus]MXU64898.1 NAD(P)-binding domain-containing protein [Oceanomicrobium pacificus]